MLTALGLTGTQLLAASAAILFAAVLRGFTGFGFALAAVPLASLVMPPQQTVAAVLIMQLGIGFRDCIVEWKHVEPAVIGRLTLGGVVGMPLGVAALALASPSTIRAALGVLVLVAVALTWKPRPAHHAASARVTLATGFASGVMHGLAAMAGPPVVAYFLAFERRLHVMRSSLMVFFPLVSLLGLPMVAYAGLLDSAAVILGVIGMPIMLAGGWLGTHGFRRWGGRSYRPVALAALLATAAASILRSLGDLMG
jgi:uncharacterized membrane protein YfcA